MKSNKYEPRACEICGKLYKPGRKDQKTCGSKECLKLRLRATQLKWHSENYARTLENNRRSRKLRQEKADPKPDTIVAIGYAERQMAETLKKAGRVKTEL